MSKYIKPWRPLLFFLAQSTAFTAHMPSYHMNSAQSSELACLPQEPQSHNEAQDLLRLREYVCKLTNAQRTLEDTCALLQQTEFLGVINEQDCRAIRTACCCLKSLRIRVEARANVTEREVISRQLQLILCVLFGLVWLWLCFLFVCLLLFWFGFFLMGLLTGLCIGPLPALLRLSTN